MELSKLVEEILKITNESPSGCLHMDSAEAGEIWKLLNKELKRSEQLCVNCKKAKVDKGNMCDGCIEMYKNF